MIRTFSKLSVVSCALLASFCPGFNLEAGIIPWTYSAIFGPPGSVAQMRAERLAYRAPAYNYGASYGYASGYGYGYPMSYGYSGVSSYSGNSVGYSPFDSGNCCGSTMGYAGYGYVPNYGYSQVYANTGCSSCSGSGCTAGCSGPGCAAAVTPAGGMKPQVEPNLANPNNPTPINPTPNPNYLDQPKPANSTFKDQGFNGTGNTNAPGFVPPVNMETKMVPKDAIPPAKIEGPLKDEPKKEEMKKDEPKVEKVEVKKEELKKEEPAKADDGKSGQSVDEIIKKRQPAPPAMPEAKNKDLDLEIPNPAPVAQQLPTRLALDVAPTRVVRTARFVVPAVVRSEAQAIPASFPAELASK